MPINKETKPNQSKARSLKRRDFSCKKLANTKKKYIDIDIYYASAQFILIKFDYWYKVWKNTSTKDKRLQSARHHKYLSIDEWKNIFQKYELKIVLSYGNDRKHYRWKSFENPEMKVNEKVKHP